MTDLSDVGSSQKGCGGRGKIPSPRIRVTKLCQLLEQPAHLFPRCPFSWFNLRSSTTSVALEVFRVSCYSQAYQPEGLQRRLHILNLGQMGSFSANGSRELRQLVNRLPSPQPRGPLYLPGVKHQACTQGIRPHHLLLGSKQRRFPCR